MEKLSREAWARIVGGAKSFSPAIISYNGFLHFGLLADYDALPEVEALGDMIEQAADELVGLAREARPRFARAPQPVGVS